MIMGKDFAFGADTVFMQGNYGLENSEAIATVLGVAKRFKYDEQGHKTDIQIGWSYKTYVPNRDMMININVDELFCAIDAMEPGLTQVKFTGFSATFYVDRKGFLQLSCKAEKAERVGK